MLTWKREREERLCAFFGLSDDAELISGNIAWATPASQVEEHLARFNIEWHIIPSAERIPFDETYIELLYSGRAAGFACRTSVSLDCRQALIGGHRRHQGQIIAVETTQKPQFLPRNRQHYGTPYGYDPAADPLQAVS